MILRITAIRTALRYSTRIFRRERKGRYAEEKSMRKVFGEHLKTGTDAVIMTVTMTGMMMTMIMATTVVPEDMMITDIVPRDMI